MAFQVKRFSCKIYFGLAGLLQLSRSSTVRIVCLIQVVDRSKLHFSRVSLHSFISLSLGPGATHGTNALSPFGNTPLLIALLIAVVVLAFR